MLKPNTAFEITELLTRKTDNFVANFPGNLYLVDKNFIIYACSDLMAKTFGHRSGHYITGLSVSEFPTPECAPEIVEDCRKVFETGESVFGERTCLDCNGTPVVYSTQKVPLKDTNGNIYALLAVALDITAQKKLEKTRRREEKNFKDILSVIPAPLYWKNLNGEYLGCSKKQSEIAQLSCIDDIVGLNDFQLPWAQHAEHYREQDALVAKTGMIHTFEDCRVEADGTENFFLSIKQPLRDEEGEIMGIIGTTIDVTNQKKLERLEKRNLEKKLELQEAFRKVVMQANHDIGSPLLVLDLFAHKYLESASEEQRNSVRNSINRIRAIASSMLLRFAEHNPDSEQSWKCDTLLFPLLLEAINEKRLEYPNAQIQLKNDQDPHVIFAFFNANAHAFKRMISNIINNSMDALANTINPLINIEINKIQNKIIVTISDNGSGMSDMVKNKIHANIPVTEGKKSGHGIGYIQIRETLALHNANLEIESSKGEGSRVTLTFPALENSDYIPREIILDCYDIIVIVDDDPSIHEAWDLRFSEISHSEVKHFTQGRKALEYVMSLPQSLKSHVYLLTDHELLNQDINGIDLINQLNLKKSILVTSHYLNNDLIAEVKSCGTKMLPKILAENIPLGYASQNQSPTCPLG
ncbi:MAG: PAS domain-containing protein [Myxococcaceae bacterium]